MKKDHVTDPLLYIDQPLFKKPTPVMQQQFFSTDLKKSSNQEKHPKMEDVAFKHLSVEEQINYLMSLPKEVPSIRCEIVVEDKKYRGIIVKEELEWIVLRMVGRGNQKIFKDDIDVIRLIGF